MKKAISKMAIGKEKAFWNELKNAVLAKSSKFCQK